jgi:multidrug efflux pump
MRFTDLFVKRPVLAIVVNLVILIAGLQSIRALSVRQYPRSDIAVVRVTTAYVGADADLVRGFITTPLERVIASADGIDYVESSSAQSVSTITVHLKLNYDTNAALTQIQAKVAQVRNDLPPEAEAPIIQLETADTQFAAMYLGFSSSDLDQTQITDYLTRVVQPKLSAISGVQRADILGDRTFAMRIWLKPDRMAAHGISPSALRDALARNNYLSALGRTKGSMVSVNLVANTDLRTAEEFRQLVVKEHDGVVVRLGDVADVVLGAENYDVDVRFNGETAVFMGIWVLPTANALEVIERVRAAMPAVQSQLPVGMKAGIPYDSTEYIQDAIKEVLTTLTETLLIVIVVIFLFLGSVRAVIIPIVAIPISLVGAVFLMLAFGFTVNLLTLLAIVLSVGLVVDDAIVMVENVERHLHAGKRPHRAALDAARELVGPIISMTITLAAVYAPIGIQGGLTGALFREFAFTLAGAVIVSGVVALTLSPMMGARLLRAGDTERGFAGWINRRFDSLRHAYMGAVSRSLMYRPVVLTVWAIVALLIVPFYMFSMRELAPAEDQGVVFSIVQAAPNSTIEQTKLFSHQISGGCRNIRADLSDERLRRHGHQAVERPDEDRPAAPDGSGGPAREDPRRPRVSPDAAAAPGRRRFSGGSRHRVRGRAAAARGHREAVGAEGVRQRAVHLRRRRSEVRSAAGGGRIRSGQAAVAGCRPQPGRPRPVHASRRRLRQSLQHHGAELQGHSADRTGRAADARSALADLHHGIRRRARAALDLRQLEDDSRAAGAEEVSAAQRRPHTGRHSAARRARYGPALPRGRSPRDPAPGLHDRLRR